MISETTTPIQEKIEIYVTNGRGYGGFQFNKYLKRMDVLQIELGMMDALDKKLSRSEKKILDALSWQYIRSWIGG